jgi:serine/threonine-protein kinase
MGSVWEGIHVTLGNRVAVKFIEADYADNDEARTRFENEARAAARLQSKYVVQVFDYGVMPDGRPFIVMEFLSGESLDARLERCGQMSPAETTRIIGQVSRALAKAHAVGIVHRDLKPENVFLVRDDDDGADIAKVVDFGIAKFTDTSMGVSSSTRTGSVLGTPYYMSPEQARGLRSVDYRSDLWSLGVIVFRCLTGRYPFEGEAIGDLLVKICTAPLPVPSQVTSTPPAFDAWFDKAMQRDPALRFSSANELAEQLARCFGVSSGRGQLASIPLDLASTGLANVQGARNAKEETGIPLSRTLGKTMNRGKSGLAIVLGVGAILILGSVGGVWWLVSRKSDAEHAASAAPPTAMSQTTLQPPAPSQVQAAPVPQPVVVAPSATPSAAPGASASAAPAAPIVLEQVRRPAVRAGAGAPRAAAPSRVVTPEPTPARPRPAKPETDLGY